MNVTKLGRRILQSLSHKILLGQIPPSGKLPSIRALADEYGASTVIIREAVIVLETLGIVRIEHGKGVFLREPDRLIDQLFHTRYELDRIIVQDAALKAAPEDLSFLKERVEAMDRAASEPGGAAGYGRIDREFHERIIGISGNFIVGNFLSLIRSAVYLPGEYRRNMLARDPEHFVKSNENHWKIYRALEAVDPRAAAEAAALHEERVRSGWEINLELWKRARESI